METSDPTAAFNTIDFWKKMVDMKLIPIVFILSVFASHLNYPHDIVTFPLTILSLSNHCSNEPKYKQGKTMPFVFKCFEMADYWKGTKELYKQFTGYSILQFSIFSVVSRIADVFYHSFLKEKMKSIKFNQRKSKRKSASKRRRM